MNPLNLDTTIIDETNSEMTNPHGMKVLTILTSLSKNPIYHFFTTVNADGEFTDRHMLATFQRILDFSDEIDIVNISAGLDHISGDRQDCNIYGPKCSVCKLAKEVLSENIVIVAGAGNKPHTLNICCPSLEKDVVSVGGGVIECTASIEPDSVWDAGSLAQMRPPNALWIERDDGKGASGTYCSDRGCYPGSSCNVNRKLSMWEGTPKTDTGKPDILAPLIFPSEDNVGPLLEVGTSYAAPIVSAEVGNILNMLKAKSINPRPPEVRAAIERGGQDISEPTARFFDVIGFANELGDNYGIEFEN